MAHTNYIVSHFLKHRLVRRSLQSMPQGRYYPKVENSKLIKKIWYLRMLKLNTEHWWQNLLYCIKRPCTHIEQALNPSIQLVCKKDLYFVQLRDLSVTGEAISSTSRQWPVNCLHKTELNLDLTSLRRLAARPKTSIQQKPIIINKVSSRETKEGSS